MIEPGLSPEAKKGGIRLIAAIVLGHAIKHLYQSGFQAIIQPELKLGLGLSNTLLGVIATARQVGSGVTTLGAGYVGDRFSEYASIILGISLTFLGISYFITGYAESYWVILAAMVLAGVAPSLYHPPAIGALSRRFPDRRGLVISLHGTGGSIGEAIGPLVAAAAVLFLAWRGTLQWSLIPVFVAAFLVWLMMRNVFIPSGYPSPLRSYFGSVGNLLKDRTLLAILATSAIRGMAQSIIFLFLPVYLREEPLAYSVTMVAVYISMSQVVGIVAQPIMGVLSDRLGRKSVLAPSMIVLGVLCGAIGYVEPGFFLATIILGIGAFLYSLHAIFIAAASDHGSPEMQSTIASLAYGASFVTSILSPVVAGVIADLYGIPSAFLFAGALFVIGGVWVILLKLPKVGGQPSD